jgi:hypothetical protein
MRLTMVLHYRDDGPSGPCGQTVSTTAPWSRLYHYENEDDAVAFMRYVRDNPLKLGRRNPRIESWWHAEHVYEGPVVPEAERGGA